MTPVRIGLLGCGRLGTYGLIEPAREIAELEVVAVASRDAAKGRAYADDHGVPRACTYRELIDDPELDAIHIALPNSMHAEWSIRALEAGKAVLCEKPLTANAAEAREAVNVARRVGRPFVEAVHWLHHPLAARLAEICRSGMVGHVQSVDVRFLYSERLLEPDDIRRNYAMGGGVLPDTGHYCVRMLRHLLGEPVRLHRADAIRLSPDVDIEVKAEFEFDGGAIGRLETGSRLRDGDVDTAVDIQGSHGSVHVMMPFTPQLGGTLQINAGGKIVHEDVDMRSTYFFQALDFVDVVRDGKPSATPASDGIATMEMIDGIYHHLGMKPRGM